MKVVVQLEDEDLKMDAPSTALLRLKHIKPKHLEIMDRLICGQKEKEIAQEMGMSQSRLSIIVNSPLFQLELRKKLARREVKFMEIQENLLEAANLGTKLHKEVLEGNYPTELKMKSATVMAGLAMRLFPVKEVSREDGGNGGGGSYEERLREVTVRESVRTVTKEEETPPQVDSEITKLLESEYPPEEAMVVDESDELFGEIDPDDNFEPFPKEEEVLKVKDGSN